MADAGDEYRPGPPFSRLRDYDVGLGVFGPGELRHAELCLKRLRLDHGRSFRTY
jgi:hypothetical protein